VTTVDERDHALRADIADVLVRYASGIDRRDWTLFRTCFTHDCEADYGDIGAWHGVDAITEWMERAHEGCSYTLHRITNIAVEPTGHDQARARCYVDALVLSADGGGVHAAGFYDDELVLTDSVWRIARRRFTMVHVDADVG
jgi:3-phenylpropionate/cinnamic acid dioxygenase small subunit